MPMMNPEAMNAVPAMGNPQMGQTPKLPPDQIAALRKSPNVVAAVAKFIGRPVPMQMVPDNLIVEIAGMVHKLGVDGAVAAFSQKVPPQVQAQLKAAVQQGGSQAPQGMPPQ